MDPSDPRVLQESHVVVLILSSTEGTWPLSAWKVCVCVSTALHRLVRGHGVRLGPRSQHDRVSVWAPPTRGALERFRICGVFSALFLYRRDVLA